MLTSDARITNKSVDLTTSPKKKKLQISHDIQQVINFKSAAHKTNLTVSTDPASSESEKIKANNVFQFAKAQQQNITRRHNNLQECERDSHFFSKTPQQVFQTLKSRSQKILIRLNLFLLTESYVAFGFFYSISKLKTLDTITANSYKRFSSNFKQITEVCKQVPRIQEYHFLIQFNFRRKF